jgi:threonine/homoserine/homoserine lactone efflux protein
MLEGLCVWLFWGAVCFVVVPDKAKALAFALLIGLLILTVLVLFAAYFLIRRSIANLKEDFRSKRIIR